MTLSKPAILEQHGRGIIIDPFENSSLKTTSYDVRIGRFFFRQHRSEESGHHIFNPYDEQSVRDYYGEVQEAQPARDHKLYSTGKEWRGIDPEDLIILLQPDEMILGHTEEFVGGTKDAQTGRCFSTEMRARSSTGRVGFEACRCAGWGDCGYINRWTMEIVCTSKMPIPLVVGTRLAQIVFFEVPTLEDTDLYGYDPSRDHYQSGGDIEEIKNAWKPEMMLPRLSKR